ncbi:hypothetical protein Ddc_12969 [Ditylenchus destructor]|nr:hypothetical protein Ddc_12969 [Ditylenchus destructor]
MVNRNNARRRAKRRRDQASAAVQNQPMLRKLVIILDDSWLEALKHLTCRQWSRMSLICRHVNGIVQRNISRLPRQVIYPFDLVLQNLSRKPRFTSIQKLFHPASYVKNVAMHTVEQKLIDASYNGEKRYICCQEFELLPYSNKSSTPQKIAQSLNWLVRNVRSDSISIPEWMFNRIHKNVKVRAMLTNFIFGTSQKCKARELEFYVSSFYCTYSDDLSSVKLVDILIEDFLALPVFQSTIPTVVIYYYPSQEEYRKKFGENLIGRVMDSQSAEALYDIENGDKRIRISFCRRYSYENTNIYRYKAYLKFYSIREML